MSAAARGLTIGAIALVAVGLSVDFALRAWPNQPELNVYQQTQTFTGFVPGLAFIGAGLVAWLLRPHNRVGLLMVGVGFLSLVGSEVGFLPFPTGLYLYGIIGMLWPTALAHLIVAFPTGRLATRWELALICTLYAIVALVGLDAVIRGTPPGIGSAATLEFAYVAVLVFLAGLVIRRWLTATPASRRSLTPALLSLVPIVLSQVVPLILAIAIGALQGRDEGQILVFYDLAPLLLAAAPIGLLIGLVRSQLDMSEIGSLIVEFQGGLLPELIQPALARVLHDPNVEVLYWVPDRGEFTDLEGNPTTLPKDKQGRQVVLLGDPPLAAIVHSAPLQQGPELLTATSAAVQLALENARLQAELKAQLRELRLSRTRLVDTADSERRRVERDLHDGAQQQLVTLLLQLQLARREALERSELDTARALETNIESLKQALAELRELARGIHPTILAEAGLLPAIHSLAERSHLPVQIAGDFGRIEPRSEVALYFVVAEALTNAAKHSQGSRVWIDLGRRNGVATVEISDDGVGGADLSKGSGLLGLSDRLAAVGGRLQVKTVAGNGTRISAEVPCE